MQNVLYIVRFETPLGRGSGVVVVRKAEALATALRESIAFRPIGG
jgi:hypothetical protein